MISVKQASQNWGVSERRVQKLCNDGRIKGAIKFGRVWMIPSHAVLPKQNKNEKPHLAMPRKTPFLDMTDIYNKKGEADQCGEMLINNPEAHALYVAQIEYRRGEIDKVYDKARYFLSAHSGFYAILGGGMLLAQCAIWRGDIALWNEAKQHILEAPCNTQTEREIVSLALAIVNSSVYDNKNYPDWFKIGNFEVLPAAAHPSAKVFYVKYLYMAAYAIATKQLNIKGIEGLSLMGIIPNTIEPLISQAIVDKTIIPEIYLRMSCAVAYYNSGDKESALRHLDKAIDLALADNLYGILTEYVRHFSGLLEERVALKDENAVIIITELNQKYKIGWAKLSGAIRNRLIVTSLTPREYEVAKLTVFGLNSKEIANILYVSDSTIKQTIARIMNKTGAISKKEFVNFL